MARSWAVEERKNFVNSSPCSSSGMPMPVSLTVEPRLAVVGLEATA